MEPKTEIIIITIGLKEDDASGLVLELPIEILAAAAQRIIAEQEKCELCRYGGAVARLILAYAELLGYKDAYFVEARRYK